MINVKVGQKVWIKNRGHYRMDDNITEEVVVKVGRSYIYVKSKYGKDTPYDKNTGMEHVDSNYKNRLYESREQIENEQELANLKSFLKKAFDYNPQYSLETLRAVKKLLDEN
jgi:hypothetical protein